MQSMHIFAENTYSGITIRTKDPQSEAPFPSPNSIFIRRIIKTVGNTILKDFWELLLMQAVFNAKSPAPLNETDMMFYRVLKKGDVYRESTEKTMHALEVGRIEVTQVEVDRWKLPISAGRRIPISEGLISRWRVFLEEDYPWAPEYIAQLVSEYSEPDTPENIHVGFTVGLQPLLDAVSNSDFSLSVQEGLHKFLRMNRTKFLDEYVVEVEDEPWMPPSLTGLYGLY
ncbi:uncharacterized protein EV420DRAFT_1473779 [Desarmillaria tabescens]|uniref:Uncharacterized protein n=1 Tax=Armillaria tabescens TaxID=1929756 RepID=A0AA39U0C0_ARMTA|nr:uncharacterized protein EV420DRAFT_1473779 [Desarmillaria tabescens]KAK0467999.1 hypothetical protein EV420DRAFT_1473779 [Desarmillaria tabescens]